MKNSRSTKRALISSVIALFICFTMLLGTTYAWFTDTAASANNKIVAGTLDVELWQHTATGSENISDSNKPVFTDSIIWEPGQTETVYLSIRNNGNLELKYKVLLVVTSVSHDDLTKVMEYAITPDATYSESEIAWNGNGTKVVKGQNDTQAIDVVLQPGDEHFFALSVHMLEEAGNEFMAESISFDIMVLAGQAVNGNETYDEDAIYPVSNAEELISAIESGANVSLSNDIALDTAMTVSGNVSIDLNGYDLDASAAGLTRPFIMTEGSSLTINAEGATVTVAGHGLVNVPGTVKNAEITLNGGTYVGETVTGSLIRLREGNEKVNVTLNNVTYVDNSNNGYIFSASGFAGEGVMTVNGGSFSANYGFQIYGLDATLTGVEIITNGTAVEASEGSNVVVDNCDITVVTGVTVVNAHAAGVAASHGGTATVKNSTIAGNMKAVYYVYNSGANIVAENNDVTGANYEFGLWRNDTPATLSGSITIDGVVVSQVN